MIFTEKAKKIKVMFTPFRDGLQSSFGGKVRLNDYLPAMKASAEAGIRHFEFGGGARFQAPLFYLNEHPFETMQAMRDALGPEVDLQILTRSVSGVTLTNQSIEGLDLQAKLMKKHGTTWDRNFDYMNDVQNLIKTAKPIINAGMHHQVCVALMGMPFYSDKVHTAEFYINIAKKLLESGIRIDSMCLKDASGTTDPKTIYDTVIGLKKIMPPEMPLWLHTHDTASIAIVCYMAGIEAGVDGVDLSVRPMASGTVQPDVRSLAHGLKGTGYSLDINVSKIREIEFLLTEGLKEYDFNPVTTSADARVLAFPMPGGAIGPNVHMMAKAGILHRYSDILAEFPFVVEAGGAWTSVTPGSQQYWVQAFNNIMYGRWEKIDEGYGKAVLGYFGKTPLPPDPEVIKKAGKQLNLPVFTGDPLEAAPKNIEPARKALQERNLPINDENIFIVLASMVPGKNMELNEGIKYLSGQSKLDIPLKKKEVPKNGEAKMEEKSKELKQEQLLAGPVKTKCIVEENGKIRTFIVTSEPIGYQQVTPTGQIRVQESVIDKEIKSLPVYHPFEGVVLIVEILVKQGDPVQVGQTLAFVEAMKAKHHIKAQANGVITKVNARVGDEIDSSTPLMLIN